MKCDVCGEEYLEEELKDAVCRSIPINSCERCLTKLKNKSFIGEMWEFIKARKNDKRNNKR